MTEPATQPAPPPRRKTLRVVLLVSLALNLLVIGVVAGALISRGGEMRQRAVVMDLSFGPYTRALDEEGRAALREAWRGRSSGMHSLGESYHAEFAEFIAALRGTPFEKARVEDIMARQHQRGQAQEALARQLLAEHLARMSPAARAAYAERLESIRHGMAHRAGPNRR